MQETPCHVVPHAGRWIEMVGASDTVTDPSSFPTREGGLKLDRAKELGVKKKSFPTREGGLK